MCLINKVNLQTNLLTVKQLKCAIAMLSVFTVIFHDFRGKHPICNDLFEFEICLQDTVDTVDIIPVAQQWATPTRSATAAMEATDTATAVSVASAATADTADSAMVASVATTDTTKRYHYASLHTGK